MAFRITTNHDEIRSWIEKHGGIPAVITGVPASQSASVLSVRFDNNPELEEITWEEFFDDFETNNLAFRHSNDAKPGSEGFGFNFTGRTESGLMPDDVDTTEENMFPSVASDTTNIDSDVNAEQY